MQNLPTPNKKYTINTRKDSSRNKKNIKIERNVLFDYNSINNAQAKENKRQKSLNKNSTLKLMLNQMEQDNYNLNLNDFTVRYKLKLYEKNNIINKLKDELEYYKNYYHSMNPTNAKNTITPNHNTINATDNFYSINRLTHGLEEKNKIIKTENMRNKIKNIFTLRKNDIKDFRSDHNIKLNLEKIEAINYPKMHKDSALTLQNKSESKSINKLIMSNDMLKLNKKTENNSNIPNNVFNRSNSNTIKRKIKIGLHLSELNLDDNKYNSIEANRNHVLYIRNKKNYIHSLNKNLFMKGIYEKENENENNKFNYIEKFENLKKRMNIIFFISNI